MDIYFAPELIKQEAQVLNIVNSKQKAVGYLTFIFDQKKMYVYGHLEDQGVKEDFKDLVKPYIQGMKKAKPELDIFSYINVGGEKLDIGSDSESESK